MPRVESKHLFNFLPRGTLDPDVADAEAIKATQVEYEYAKNMKIKMAELMMIDDEESDKAFAAMLRSLSAAIIQEFYSYELPDGATVQIEDMAVPTNHDGSFAVPVHVYTPGQLIGEEDRAAYIYAHGGAGVALSAKLVEPPFLVVAVECNVVVFNVDYRLAPETKCPNNVRDFYETIKYVSKNAASLGIDPNKIAIAGDSGGGYICLGAMVLLAQNEESGLVKLAMPGVPMVDDYSFSDPAAMTKEERESAHFLRKVWKLIAADLESQSSSPLLFPGKASDELLEKFPPTIIREAEFDMFITEATRLATRLRRAGRLLEFIVVPGATHTALFNPQFECAKTWNSTMKMAIEEYLHK